MTDASISMEEENHARQFEFASKLPNVIAQAAVDAGAVNELLAQVQAFDARMRTDTPAPADALRAVITMEHSLAGYHMNSIGVFTDPNLQKLFEAMMAADKQHAQTLHDALDRLAPPPTTH